MTTNATQTRPRAGEGVGSPIRNEAYNVISALHAKLEGLEAIRKYSQDGNERFWQQLSQQDNQAVETLIQELERLVRDGQFRLQTPGRAG
jgi:hypothetical protein